MIHKYEGAVIHTHNPDKNRTGGRPQKNPNPRVDFQPKYTADMYEYDGSPGLTAWLTLPHVRYPITATGLFKYSIYTGTNTGIYCTVLRGASFFTDESGGGKYNNSFIMRYSCLLLDGSGSVEIITDPEAPKTAETVTYQIRYR
jgi:hypothetical protein